MRMTSVSVEMASYERIWGFIRCTVWCLAIRFIWLLLNLKGRLSKAYGLTPVFLAITENCLSMTSWMAAFILTMREILTYIRANRRRPAWLLAVFTRCTHRDRHLHTLHDRTVGRQWQPYSTLRDQYECPDHCCSEPVKSAHLGCTLAYPPPADPDTLAPALTKSALSVWCRPSLFPIKTRVFGSHCLCGGVFVSRFVWEWHLTHNWRRLSFIVLCKTF